MSSEAAHVSAAASAAQSGGEPKDLIKREDIEQAVRAERGPQAVLKSYVIKDFTSVGDNYNCVVTSVIVRYETTNGCHDTSYVVKLNPRGPEGFIAEFMFKKEIGFYNEILPLINEELVKVDETKLRMPRCFHCVAKESEEVMYLEDLRRSGYKMLDRKKVLDQEHVNLILKELARLHAGSLLVMARKEFEGEDILQQFPSLIEAFNPYATEGNRNEMFLQAIENMAKIAENSSGYEFVAKFLREKKASALEDFVDQISPKDPFRVICHGDSWSNNFLYRYGPDGAPVDCRLLDLQVIRVGSPALDLNYMFYCSLDRDVRTRNLDTFFSNYYASFARVLAAAGQPVKFTLSQLREEFYAKNLFGLYMAAVLVPPTVMDAEDAFSFGDFQGDEVKDRLKEFEEKVMNTARKNPQFVPRFLSMFDEMKEAGLFRT